MMFRRSHRGVSDRVFYKPTHYFSHFPTFSELLYSKGMRHVLHGNGVDLYNPVILTAKQHKNMQSNYFQTELKIPDWS